jgi:hypothetical protein
MTPPACSLVCWTYFFGPEDGGDKFLRNVGCNSTDYTASYPRRWYSSLSINVVWYDDVELSECTAKELDLNCCCYCCYVTRTCKIKTNNAIIHSVIQKLRENKKTVLSLHWHEWRLSRQRLFLQCEYTRGFCVTVHTRYLGVTAVCNQRCRSSLQTPPIETIKGWFLLRVELEINYGLFAAANEIRDEILRRISWGNICYRSVQQLFPKWRYACVRNRDCIITLLM